MTNVPQSGVVPRSPGTCTGLYLAGRMLKVKSRQGEQSVPLNLEQRDAERSGPKNRNFGIKDTGGLIQLDMDTTVHGPREREGPRRQMVGCVRKRNKNYCVCVCVSRMWQWALRLALW